MCMNDGSRISVTSIRTFKRCRRKWYYKYVERMSPKQKASYLNLGVFIHKAMESHYSALDWKQAVHDLAAESIQNTVNKMQLGYDWDEALAVEKTAEINNLRNRAVEIMGRYIEFDRTNPLVRAGWKVLGVEVNILEWELTIPGTDIFLEGFIDMVLEDEYGGIWAVEHKTGAQFFSVESLDLDEQASTYLWALSHRYPDKKVSGIIYNLVRTKVPSIPQMLKSGEMSRSKIDTTWDIYVLALRENGLNEQDYGAMKDRLSLNHFFKRDQVYRSQVELGNFEIDLQDVIHDIEDTMNNARFTRTPTKDCTWECPFREICIMEYKGLDIGEVSSLKFTKRSLPPTEQDFDQALLEFAKFCK